MVRQFLLWWFSPPESPWVCGNFTVDTTAAQAYLKRLNRDQEVKISLQHLISATVARALKEVPEANARIFGDRIVPQPHVGIAMPVNLLGHEGGKERELSMMIMEEVDKKSLCEVATIGRQRVKEERKGKMQNSFLANLMQLAKRLPPKANKIVFEKLDRALQSPVIAKKVFERLPVTTAISNPGSTYPSGMEGALFQGGSFHPPQRIAQVGTFWGISGIQNEVIPIDGAPAVRPMLPVMLIFDHRLIDGVKAAQLSLLFVEIFLDPASYFGDDGGIRS